MGEQTQAESSRQKVSMTASVTCRELVIKRLIDASGGNLARRGVPERFQLKDWSDVIGLENEIKQAQLAISAGDSVTLTGKAGSGKTLIAVCLIRTWLRTAAEMLIPDDSEVRTAYGYTVHSETLEEYHAAAHNWMVNCGDRVLPRFISACEFFLRLKASFSTEETERDIIGKLTKSKALLVLDDLGAEKVSDWSRQVLFTLIDRRYRDCQPIVVTSNLSLQELARHYDDRIASRLVEMGAIINLKADDYRLKTATSRRLDAEK